jgi:hypothetical protein
MTCFTSFNDALSTEKLSSVRGSVVVSDTMPQAVKGRGFYS